MIDEDKVIFEYREQQKDVPSWVASRISVIKRDNGQLQFSVPYSGITLPKEEAERLIVVLDHNYRIIEK